MLIENKMLSVADKSARAIGRMLSHCPTRPSWFASARNASVVLQRVNYRATNQRQQMRWRSFRLRDIHESEGMAQHRFRLRPHPRHVSALDALDEVEELGDENHEEALFPGAQLLSHASRLRRNLYTVDELHRGLPKCIDLMQWDRSQLEAEGAKQLLAVVESMPTSRPSRHARLFAPGATSQRAHNILLMLGRQTGHLQPAAEFCRQAKAAGHRVTVVLTHELALQQSKDQLLNSANVDAVLPLTTDFTVDDDFTCIIDGVGDNVTLPREEDRESFLIAINAMNHSRRHIVSVESPSGLCGNTGIAKDKAVYASVTVCFGGLVRGLFTGQAPDHTGSVVLADLGLSEVFAETMAPDAELVSYASMKHHLPARRHYSDKTDYGLAVLAGGGPGLPGSIRLAGEAAQRVGAGLVRLFTHRSNVAPLGTGRETFLIHAWRDEDLPAQVDALLSRAKVMALGPGLGQTPWTHSLLSLALRKRSTSLIVDADALKILAQLRDYDPRADPDKQSPDMYQGETEEGRVQKLIITPHSREAAMLLGTTQQDIEADRFESVRRLQRRYGGTVLLKGPGTLVCGPEGPVHVVLGGNPGMATAGMGDMLTGVISGLLAQGLSVMDATVLGACMHATAGDIAAEESGERGMIPHDLLGPLRLLANPI